MLVFSSCHLNQAFQFIIKYKKNEPVSIDEDRLVLSK